MAMPGAQDPGTSAAMQAMQSLGPKPPGSAAMGKVEEAFDMAYKLIMSAIPQMGQWNPKLARDAHAAARTLLGIKSGLRQEAPPQPPPDMMLGMGMAGGSPGPSGPGGMPGMGA